MQRLVFLLPKMMTLKVSVKLIVKICYPTSLLSG